MSCNFVLRRCTGRCKFKTKGLHSLRKFNFVAGVYIRSHTVECHYYCADKGPVSLAMAYLMVDMSLQQGAHKCTLIMMMKIDYM